MQWLNLLDYCFCFRKPCASLPMSLCSRNVHWLCEEHFCLDDCCVANKVPASAAAAVAGDVVESTAEAHGVANKTPAATASAAEASATIKKPIVGDDLFSVDGVGAVGVSAFLPVVADVASFNKEPLTQLPPIPSSSSGNSSVVDDLQRRKAAESAPVSADAIAKGLQTLFSGLTANAPAEMFSL